MRKNWLVSKGLHADNCLTKYFTFEDEGGAYRKKCEIIDTEGISKDNMIMVEIPFILSVIRRNEVSKAEFGDTFDDVELAGLTDDLRREVEKDMCRAYDAKMLRTLRNFGFKSMEEIMQFDYEFNPDVNVDGKD